MHEAEKPLKKEQISICLGTLLPGANDPDAPALQVMNAILSARLGLELREKQGLAYSVGSSVTFDRNFGWLMIQLGTGKGNFALAQKGVSAEIEKLQSGGVGEDELQKAKKSLWGNYLLANLARLNQTYWMAVNEFVGRGFDYDQKFVARLETVTTNDVQRAAQQYLNLKQAVLATAGMR
jgi:zinc protease